MIALIHESESYLQSAIQSCQSFELIDRAGFRQKNRDEYVH